MWLLLHEANKLRNRILKEAFDWVDHKIPPSKEEQARRRHATTDSKGQSIYNPKKRKTSSSPLKKEANYFEKYIFCKFIMIYTRKKVLLLYIIKGKLNHCHK